MPSIKAMTTSVLAIAMLALMATAQRGEAQPSYTPNELIFTVYADGYAAIDYTVVVDPTRARINITLFGSLYQDLIVEDQEGLPLDYYSANGGLTVDTLGSTSVFVSYVTHDLTAKSAQIWSFSTSSPIPCGILLPEGSTIVNLNVVPLEVGILNGYPVLTMPAGAIEVSYAVAFVGTREHALVLIKDAEETIAAVVNQGIIASEAEALLGNAYEAFGAENYIVAEQYAAQAKTAAQNVESAASSAEDAINAASISISTARGEGRTETLEAAEELLQQAEASYEAGDYEGAEALAVQAQTAAKEAKASGLPITWIAIPVVVVAALALFLVVFIQRRKEPAAEDYTGAVDLESIFERYPHLRFDDREMLRFMADSGGEAFATEIRERFDMPRTSAWRMIRRLQREGIVEVRNVGGQSLVRIRPEHRGKGGEA